MKVIAAVCEVNAANFAVIATQYAITNNEKQARIALSQARALFPDTSCILLSQSPDGRAHTFGPKILRDILQHTNLNDLPWARYKIKEKALKNLRPLKMEKNNNG